MKTVPKRASVQDARTAVSRAADHLTTWQRDDTAIGLTAGHNAVTAIDDALRALYATRQQLVGELRAEQDATMARVDALLAHGSRTQRTAAQVYARGGATA